MSLLPTPSVTGMSFSRGGQQATNTSFIQFPASSVSAIFGATGQVTMYLTSQYSFAQRQRLPQYNYRNAFDVYDNSQELFDVASYASGGRLGFYYRAGSTTQFYYVAPAGTEDSLFGQGVTLKLSVTWDGSQCKLFLNDGLVATNAYAPVTPNWGGNSVFTVGAAGNYGGGYFSSDDAISAFQVSGSGTTPTLSVSFQSPVPRSTLAGNVNLTATAGASAGVANVQFSVDGVTIGSPITAPPYSMSWNSASVSDGGHTLSVVVTDILGNASNATEVVYTANSTSDIQPPTTPTGLFTGHVTNSSITLIWNPATDKVGVGGYRVYRDGVYLANADSSSYQDTGLDQGSKHTYQVSAYDAAGNNSKLSAPVSSATASGSVLTVGPGQAYALPCTAIAAAVDGTTIEIDPAGYYGGDTCTIRANNITLRGLSGRARISAGAVIAQSKGIWVVDGNDVTIENIEFSGATIVDALGGNGAGIRSEGNNLTVRNCYFHHNQNGILTNNLGTSNIVIDFSEFGFNGSGTGYTHNLYVGEVASLTLRYSYSHDCSEGHLVKSRAATNYILYNRLSDENTAASYELDLPNGGLSYVIGNILEQASTNGNPNMLMYGEEGAIASNPNHDLFVVNNTFDNRMGSGGYFVNVASAMNSALVQNNIFNGPGTLIVGQAQSSYNLSGLNFLFNNLSNFDYTLQFGSPAIGAGSLPGSGDGYSLVPAYEYIHPAGGKAVGASGPINVGAYSY